MSIDIRPEEAEKLKALSSQWPDDPDAYNSMILYSRYIAHAIKSSHSELQDVEERLSIPKSLRWT